MAGIDRRRVALLDAVEAEGREGSVRAVVEAMVLPLAEQLDPAADGGHYIRFLAQAISDPGVDVGGLVRDKFDHGMVRTRRLARRILARQAAANKEIVVITDGEPTAHFENGQVEFSYPPTRATIQETLREVRRCTKEGITINTFMLERSRALAEFVAHMTRLNRGRAFYASPERLGEYVLVDFVGRRTRHVA